MCYRPRSLIRQTIVAIFSTSDYTCLRHKTKCTGMSAVGRGHSSEGRRSRVCLQGQGCPAFHEEGSHQEGGASAQHHSRPHQVQPAVQHQSGQALPTGYCITRDGSICCDGSGQHHQQVQHHRQATLTFFLLLV